MVLGAGWDESPSVPLSALPRSRRRTGLVPIGETRFESRAGGAAAAVTPPSDAEVFWYLGADYRWVQLTSLVALGFAMVSLVRFSLSTPWLWPMLGVVALNVFVALLAALIGSRRGLVTERSHRAKIEAWDRRWRGVAPPSVDVFLPTCGESLAVLRNTYRHVQRMQWAGRLRVVVLDDAGRPSVRELARTHGFDYLVRPDRGRLKKAGNLRFGFERTDGDYIVILDADFCPRPDFLLHTAPYLDDPHVAIVQTPQYFATTLEQGWLERTAGAVQEAFYRFIQPSRDRVNAAICCGSSALYRRSALEEIGGFAAIEHSEDMMTGIAVTRAGWRLRYVPVLITRGVCPPDLAGFVAQQYRWCNGSLYLPRWRRGVDRRPTVAQRLSYFAGTCSYVVNAVNVFVLPVPGIVMAACFPQQIHAAQFLPFLACAWVNLVLMPRVCRSHWRPEVLRVQMAYSFCHAVAIMHRVLHRTQGWVATGAVQRGGRLTRTIAATGVVTILATAGSGWSLLILDMLRFGPAEFWPLGLFVAGHSYIGLPLAAGLIRVWRGSERSAPVAVARRATHIEVSRSVALVPAAGA